MIQMDFNKCYVLKKDNPYFCIQLQKRVSFPDGIVVRTRHRTAFPISGNNNDGVLWFGTIVDTSGGCDYDTDNEIEFCAEDVEREYEFRENSQLMWFHLPSGC